MVVEQSVFRKFIQNHNWLSDKHTEGNNIATMQYIDPYSGKVWAAATYEKIGRKVSTTYHIHHHNVPKTREVASGEIVRAIANKLLECDSSELLRIARATFPTAMIEFGRENEFVIREDYELD